MIYFRSSPDFLILTWLPAGSNRRTPSNLTCAFEFLDCNHRVMTFFSLVIFISHLLLFYPSPSKVYYEKTHLDTVL